MNSSLEFQVDLGIGPQLVIMGTILGSIFVGVLTSSITENIPWGDTSVSQISKQVETQGEALSQAEPPGEEGADVRSPCPISDKFPTSILQWCAEIDRYSAEYELSPDLIAAIMLQESGGDPEAYSHSGAVGLMQIMPRDGIASTFMCINGPCFTSRPTILELKDPDFNIEYGIRMIANLQSRYGNIREALKLYGPMDVGYTYADKVLAIYENYQ